MSRHFVPVVDNETPKSERDDNSAAMKKHRAFDNIHQNTFKASGAGNTGRVAGMSGFKRRSDSSNGGPAVKRQPGGERVFAPHIPPAVAPFKPNSAVSFTPSVSEVPVTGLDGANPMNGSNGWTLVGSSHLLYHHHLDLYYDPTTETYLQTNVDTGEIEVQLSEPDTWTKSGPTTCWGTESWTGRKQVNEDRTVEAVDLAELGTFFGLFDGHAGKGCAEYLASHLAQNIHHCFSKKPSVYSPPTTENSPVSNLAGILSQIVECQEQRNVLLQAKAVNESEEVIGQLDECIAMLQTAADVEEEKISALKSANIDFERAASSAIVAGCSLTDSAYLSVSRKGGTNMGSTAVMALIHGQAPDDVRVIVGNVGDSRAILVRKDHAVALTIDQKPDRPDEKKRIQRAGGIVVDMGGVHRVTSLKGAQGIGKTVYLAVARAFGDIGLKDPEQLINSVPEVQVNHILPGDSGLILACDGVFDVLSNQEVVRIALEHRGQPKEAATAIVREAHRKLSSDNLTATVIEFPWCRPPFPEVETVVPTQEVVTSAVDDDLDIFA